MVKLFAKSFRKSRLFEKRRHPETFILFEIRPGQAASSPGDVTDTPPYPIAAVARVPAFFLS
ncbi:hypothetical protein CXP35_06955 [Komagataeibacter xylinus]|nr:hypothetical protein CXP35_06955 [Komagataeibacter xylinus]